MLKWQRRDYCTQYGCPALNLKGIFASQIFKPSRLPSIAYRAFVVEHRDSVPYLEMTGRHNTSKPDAGETGGAGGNGACGRANLVHPRPTCGLLWGQFQ